MGRDGFKESDLEKAVEIGMEEKLGDAEERMWMDMEDGRRIVYYIFQII